MIDISDNDDGCPDDYPIFSGSECDSPSKILDAYMDQYLSSEAQEVQGFLRDEVRSLTCDEASSILGGPIRNKRSRPTASDIVILGNAVLNTLEGKGTWTNRNRRSRNMGKAASPLELCESDEACLDNFGTNYLSMGDESFSTCCLDPVGCVALCGNNFAKEADTAHQTIIVLALSAVEKFHVCDVGSDD
jgi:hypothetical protein